MNYFVLTLTLTFSVPALACPICEWGASDAAYFIVAVFGLFALGMASFFFLTVKSGALKDNNSQYKVLEAEGVNHGNKF